MQLSLDTVRAVARLLRETDLGEIAVEVGDDGAQPCRLLVRRTAPARLPVEYAPLTLEAAPAPVAAITPDAAPAPVTEDVGGSPEPEVASLTITATAVGLFRNPSLPLQVGDVVKAGQVVGIVESLKVPNEVTAPVAGRVTELLVEEGQAVEYSQPLVTLEPILP